jgi:hypothetical protein
MKELEGILARTPQTVDEVISVLEEIEAALPDSDGLSWFNRLYLRVTCAVRDRISAAEFANPSWMGKLDVVFARRYFDALVAFERGARAPGCWRALLSRREDTAVARIQFALAGVNAHINHDLCQALVDTFALDELEPERMAVAYSDYTALNMTLTAMIESVRQEWKVRLLGDPLPAVSHLENTLAAWSLVAAREAAWTNAELLWDVRDFPLAAGRYLDVLDGLSAVAGKALLVPVPFPVEEARKSAEIA